MTETPIIKCLEVEHIRYGVRVGVFAVPEECEADQDQYDKADLVATVLIWGDGSFCVEREAGCPETLSDARLLEMACDYADRA